MWCDTLVPLTPPTEADIAAIMSAQPVAPPQKPKKRKPSTKPRARRTKKKQAAQTEVPVATSSITEGSDADELDNTIQGKPSTDSASREGDDQHAIGHTDNEQQKTAAVEGREDDGAMHVESSGTEDGDSAGAIPLENTPPISQDDAVSADPDLK